MPTYMSGSPCSGFSAAGDTARLDTQDALHLPETTQNVINNHITEVNRRQLLV